VTFPIKFTYDESVVLSLGAILWVEAIIGLYGIGSYLIDTSPNAHEGIILAAGMWFYSLFFQIPYAFFLYKYWYNTRPLVKQLTAISIPILWFLYFYPTYQGLNVV